MSRPEPLRLGSIAPNFDAETTNGPINFHEFVGDKWVVFFSHPEDYTPVCTTELGAFAKLEPEFTKRGVKLIGLSANTIESHGGWIKDIDDISGSSLKFPIIGDKERKIALAYDMIDHQDATNVDAKGIAFTIRSVFIIDPKKTIRTILSYPASTGRNTAEVLRIVDSLQTGDKHKITTPINWVPGDDVIVHPSIKTEDAKTIFPKINIVRPYLSQSSLGGRDGYTSASEQESVHSAHTSSSHQGRSSGASPALANTPTQASNLSGLVCNVHRTTGREPSPLVGATTTILGDKLYVFAGRRISRQRPVLTQDLYELDLLRRHWTKLETKGDIPSPRYFHSVCALGDNKLVCFGGMSAEQGAEQNENQETQVMVMADIHIYDVPTHTWMEVATAKSPQGRYAHCAAILPSSAVFSSANAPFCAIQNNPSGTDPNSGSIGIQIDGTGGAEMIVVGGQDSSNNYIEQISVFNLRSLTWTSTHPILGRSCGAYRSVVTPLTTMSAASIGAGPGRPDEDEDDGDDDADDADLDASGSPMLIYTNYNFLDVRLELQVRLPDGSLIDKPMQSTVSPPGLRFPTGGIIDNHFVVAGTFLTSSKQEYSLWSLDLRTLAWARIDTGSSIFSQGSWNRGLVWNRRNSFVILGNRKRSLTEDYNNRRLNFSNMCVIQLEAFGLYDNPRKTAPTSDYISGSAPTLSAMAQEGTSVGGRQLSAAAEALGVYALESRELSDMYFLGVDSSRVPVNSRVVARRWGPYFNSLLRESTNTGTAEDTATVRPAASILSRNSSITITPSIGSSLTTTHGAHTPHTSGIPTSDPADARSLPPNSRPRVFFLPHTAPTLQALVYWVYTASLPASCPTQTLCSLLQIARPYRLDGLLEAVIQRLHEILDSRNAAAVFNAAAMGAGGGRDVAFANSPSNVHPPRTASLAGLEGLSISNGGARASSGPLRIDTDVANGMASRPLTSNTLRAPEPNGNDEDDAPDSASTTQSLGSQSSLASGYHTRRESRQVWNGENSAVIGLQKRGLRGLMEGRRNRDRGSARNEVPPTPAAETTRIGLGIA
ncbi:hypothetical protein BDV97DRAFT_383040 [Delphinella strobiligena]|nr:hypothetical protein BDV97DRAFT_383040 [Delphinella strobiligena]